MTDARALAAAEEIDGDWAEDIASIITRHLEPEREAVRELVRAAEAALSSGAFEYHEAYCGYKKGTAGQRLREALTAIEQVSPALPTAHQEGGRPAPSPASPQWISVKDNGLPPWGRWVWVVCHERVQRMAARLTGDTWEWAERDADEAPLEVVTHWMPLPAPPERGKP